MFADRAQIYVKSGKGGDGHVSFRRENMSQPEARTVGMVETGEASYLKWMRV